MKRIEKPGAVFKYQGEEMKVISIAEGRVINFVPVKEDDCIDCGRGREFHLLENSPLFQDNAEPIDTLKP